MNILLKPDSSLPIYEQLVQAFKESMLNGELSPGDMLPSIRSLAKDLEISVITTKRAYEELESENLIYSHPGKGFFVKQVDFRTLQEEQLVQLEHALSSCIEDAKKLSLSFYLSFCCCPPCSACRAFLPLPQYISRTASCIPRPTCSLAWMIRPSLWWRRKIRTSGCTRLL